VGVHIPYTHKFMTNGGTPRADMLNSTSFLTTASFYLREAVCFSLPPGQRQLTASSLLFSVLPKCQLGASSVHDLCPSVHDCTLCGPPDQTLSQTSLAWK